MPKRTITLNDGSRCAEEVISYKMLFIEVSSHGKQLVNKILWYKKAAAAIESPYFLWKWLIIYKRLHFCLSNYLNYLVCNIKTLTKNWHRFYIPSYIKPAVAMNLALANANKSKSKVNQNSFFRDKISGVLRHYLYHSLSIMVNCHKIKINL